jgi:hypothetical protein
MLYARIRVITRSSAEETHVCQCSGMSPDTRDAGRMSVMDSSVPDVTLIPLSEHERDAFVEEEIADYAVQQVRDAGWSRDGALERGTCRADAGAQP